MSKPELRAQTETPLEPDLPICDAHHHLWERAPRVYLLKDLRCRSRFGPQRGVDGGDRMRLRLSSGWVPES